MALLDRFRVRNAERDLIDDLRHKWHSAAEAKKPFEKQVKLNLAFLAGKQWLHVNPVTGAYEDLTATDPEWRIRRRREIITPVYAQIVGRFIQSGMTPEVIPESQDAMDVDAAQAADKLAKWLWNRRGNPRGFAHHLPTFVRWLVAAGSAFVSWTWDESAPARAATSGGTVQGDVVIGVDSPFAIFPEPFAETWDDVTWVFRRFVMTEQQVADRWPDRAKWLKPRDVRTEVPLPGEAMSGSQPAVFPQPQTMKNAVEVREYFERPCGDHVNGRYVVLGNGGDLVLHDSDLPYGVIPIEMANYVTVPGAFWGKALLTDLIDPQRSLNELHSRVQEIIRMTLAPKLMVPVESEMSIDAWTTEPGEKILYSATSSPIEPHMLPAPPLPPYVNSEFARLDAGVQETAQLHTFNAPIRGQSRKTALEVQLMQEQDDIARLPTFRQLDEVLSRVITYAVEMAKDRYAERRLIVVGIGNRSESEALTGSDLAGTYRVEIRMSPGAAQTTMQRKAEAIQLYQLGAFGPPGQPETLRRFFRAYDMEMAAMFDREDEVDLKVAEQENFGMLHQGRYYEVGLFDQPVVHLESHLAALKEYAIDPDADADRIRLLEDHILKHRAMAKGGQGAAGQMQPNAPQPGAPRGGGPTGRPKPGVTRREPLRSPPGAAPPASLLAAMAAKGGAATAPQANPPPRL